MPEYTKIKNDELNRFAETMQNDEYDFFGESDPLLALWKRKDEWREFGEGLSDFMTMTGYTGGQDVDEKTAFIIGALKDIGVDISKATVKDWFSGKRGPSASDERSREKMFQLCFALHADKKQTEWFLNNVYLSRGFDYHRCEELIYEFCISRGLPYSEAEEMIGQIDLSDVAGSSQDKFTRVIAAETSGCADKAQLIEYINSNAADFVKWNKSSRVEIKRLMKVLQNEDCREKDEKVRDLLMHDNESAKKNTDGCSLLVRWIIKSYNLYSAETLYKDFFMDVQLYSTDFFLNTILGTTDGIDKKDENTVDIPSAVKLSFPSKKNFSDILDDSKKVSYITVRKALIFLKFVQFWCLQAVEPNEEYTREELCEAFCDEAQNMLESCGYSGLYVGNPYDWLFLYCSLDESPLECLHNVVTDVRNDLPKDKEDKKGKKGK